MRKKFTNPFFICYFNPNNVFVRLTTFLSLLILFFIFSLSACGRKAPLRPDVFVKPEQVENLKAMHDERGLTISWSYRKKVEIKGFIVLRSVGGDFERRGYIPAYSREQTEKELSDKRDTDEFSFIEKDFRTDITYKYRVIAESIKGIEGEATEIKVTPATLPEPPENIRFFIKNDSIEILWDPVKACYNIYKAYGGKDYFLLNQKPLCKEILIDRASTERPVYYRIRSIIITDIVNEGIPSKETIIRLEDYIPSPPSKINIVVGDKKVFLLWKESPEPWVRGYRIFRKVEGERDFNLVGESTIPAFIDSNLEGLENKRISYMITALGPATESDPLYGDMIYLISR